MAYVGELFKEDEKWRESLEQNPEFQDDLDELSVRFPTLREEFPSDKSRLKKLMLYPPPSRSQFKLRAGSWKLFGVCEKYSIAYFIGRRPFPVPHGVKTTILNRRKKDYGKSKAVMNFKATLRVQKDIERIFDVKVPSFARLKKRPAMSKTETNRALALKNYEILRKDGLDSYEIHKRLARNMRTSVQRVKNLLSQARRLG